jgi:hypothetical protein
MEDQVINNDTVQGMTMWMIKGRHDFWKRGIGSTQRSSMWKLKAPRIISSS